MCVESGENFSPSAAQHKDVTRKAACQYVRRACSLHVHGGVGDLLSSIHVPHTPTIGLTQKR